MEDHQRLVDQRRAGDGTADRLDLAQPRMGRDVVARLAVAAREKLLADPGDHAVILGMHAHHQSMRARGLEHVEELGVLDPQPIVGQKNLERRVAGTRERRQLLGKDLGPGIAQDHMEGVIDQRPPRGCRVVVLDHPGQTHADMLGRKRDHGGRAPERRRDRGTGERVGVDQAGRRELLDVAVAVDPARKHELARGVDLPSPGCELLANRYDHLAADSDIGRKRAGCRRDGAAPDDEVVLWHGGLQVCALGPTLPAWRASATVPVALRGSLHAPPSGGAQSPSTTASPTVTAPSPAVGPTRKRTGTTVTVGGPASGARSRRASSGASGRPTSSGPSASGEKAKDPTNPTPPRGDFASASGWLTNTRNRTCAPVARLAGLTCRWRTGSASPPPRRAVIVAGSANVATADVAALAEPESATSVISPSAASQRGLAWRHGFGESTGPSSSTAERDQLDR